MVRENVQDEYGKNVTEAHMNGIEDPVHALRLDQRVYKDFAQTTYHSESVWRVIYYIVGLTLQRGMSEESRWYHEFDHRPVFEWLRVVCIGLEHTIVSEEQ